MSSLKDIKKRLKSVKSTKKLTAAMKLIASSRLKYAMKLLIQAKSYEMTLHNTLRWGLTNLTDEQIENCKEKMPWFYSESNKEKPHLIFVFGANKGLCGSYNLSVIREALLEEEKFPKGNCFFIPLTTKTTDYFLKYKKDETECVLGLGHLSNDTGFIAISSFIIDFLMRKYSVNEIGSVSLVHGKFINALVQKVERVDLFPILGDPPYFFQEEYKITSKSLKKNSFSDLIIENDIKPKLEPSVAELIESSIKHIALMKIYSAFLESETCEQASRVTMMESANNNAENLVEKFTLKYNRTRQSNITNELMEIIAGTTSLAED